jgi:hypothetical protein
MLIAKLRLMLKLQNLKVKKDKLLHGFIITTFVSLYLIVSVISTIHVIEFFSLSNPQWLSISLAVAFEIGAAASLASLIVLDKMNKSLVWGLFIILTCMQMMGNTYYAFTNLQDYQSWVELFGLVDEDPLYQKRVLSIISGAILPLVALGFIKSLVDYIRPAIVDDVNIHEHAEPVNDLKAEQKRVSEIVKDLKEKGKLPTVGHTDDGDEPTALANSEYRLEDKEELPFIEDALEMHSLDVTPEIEAELVSHIENANTLTATQTEAVKEAKKLPATIAPVNQEEILKEFEESSEIDNINGSEKKSLI